MWISNQIIWQKLEKIDEIATDTKAISTEIKTMNERLDRIEDELKDKLDTSTFWKVIGGCGAFFLLTAGGYGSLIFFLHQ